ncbi:tRNA:m(4)X modification enzyme TRM13 homolog isoform X2 [Artemia franciscana]|uniref:tRNA:m(4)X modification enzyme TRM13 homolog isoform X2 n=1 Tax=Artemia franciscana TaxID=6661 RepID=UPI0032DB2CB7
MLLDGGSEPFLRLLVPGKMSDRIENENQCQFVVVRKKRQCKMQRLKNGLYCPEHCLQDENHGDQRIPCPLDPKHNCYKKELEKHLKKCNARPRTCAYIVKNINSTNDEMNETPKHLSDFCDDYLSTFIRRVLLLKCGAISSFQGIHEYFRKQIEELQPNAKAWKHLYQNASIIQVMKNYNLLNTGHAYIELGSGRGQLSYSVAQVLSTENTVNKNKTAFLLVDRASQRRKFDHRIKTMDEFIFERLKADLSDIVLSNLPHIENSEGVIVIAKHLCGAATDIAFQSISQCEKVMAVILAICCHHRCSWSAYCGKHFLSQEGINCNDFSLLTKISSWYTCGLKSNGSNQEHDQIAKINELTIQNQLGNMELDHQTKERIGKQCKNIINEGRLAFIRSLGFTGELITYVDPSVSPENVLLVAVRS